MKEYAFDATLFAVVRVKAETEEEARDKMADVIACLDISLERDGVTITEATASFAEGQDPVLFEIDGEAA